ncbi:MAG: pyrimidine dimer DNA glycosylase/endonuclease V [Gemmatimonadota bacterium]|nr:pyrimidine dimer DNA glycosylase/endonuclease V [Gemmatimonadota bacterium]
MRLWTLHPRYLDSKGLVALWREALLARAILRGKTKGYRHHPQLRRFRDHARPLSAINAYLAAVHAEAERRGFAFDRRKIGPVRDITPIRATNGQITYEWRHLMTKLSRRDQERHRELRALGKAEPHPLFRTCAGDIEPWERISDD